MRFRLAPTMLALLMLMVPVGRISQLQIAGRTPDLFYVDLLMLLVLVGSGFLLLELGRMWRSGWHWLLLFMGVVALGGLLTSDRLAFLGSLRPVLWALLAVMLASRVRSEREVRMILSALLLGVAAIAVEILLKVGIEGLSVAGDKGEVELDWGRSNYFATFAVLAIFVAYGLWRSACNRLELALAVLGLIAAVALLAMTKSRAAMLAAMVTTLVAGPLIVRASPAAARQPGRWLRSLCWVVLTLALLWQIYPHVLAAMGYDADTFVDSGNLRRLDAWLSAGVAFQTSPLWGIGWSNTTIMLDTLTDTATTTHSLPLQLLAETGLIGTLAIGMLLWRGLRRTGPAPKFLIHRRLRNGIRLGLLAALLHCLVEPSFWGVQFVVVFWSLLGLLHYCAERPATVVATMQARAHRTLPSDSGVGATRHDPVA